VGGGDVLMKIVFTEEFINSKYRPRRCSTRKVTLGQYFF